MCILSVYKVCANKLRFHIMFVHKDLHLCANAVCESYV